MTYRSLVTTVVAALAAVLFTPAGAAQDAPLVPAGHRLAPIVAGTDRNLIEPPDTRPTLTLDLAGSSARLPLAGGAAAFAGATS
ncbi:hypothetical protein GCM10020367_57580 [Streptomyces sannanensis]|uniref:Uncharacterized protein n=1 Tax=Streptomyces sannanensis TaxID=285536 RepID=A0ABP6SJA0_9ACTN